MKRKLLTQNCQVSFMLFFFPLMLGWVWSFSFGSVTGTNAGKKLMKRNRCGPRMGHRRARKIDFTVNLIDLLFSRCSVSRGSIKPAHKQVLTSCIFGSTPSNNCCALTGNNVINSCGCGQRIWPAKKKKIRSAKKVWDKKTLETMSQTDEHTLEQCFKKKKAQREDWNLETWFSVQVCTTELCFVYVLYEIIMQLHFVY